MPNHIQNILKFKGSPKDVHSVMNSIRPILDSDKAKIDFQQIVPMHPDLDIESSNRQDPELLKKQSENVKNYGYPTWYEWAVANWGTKWGAYATPDTRDKKNIIYFQTAWTIGEPVFIELSKRFPKVELILEFASEDTGYYQGKVSYKNGVVTQLKILENGSPAAKRFAHRIWRNK